MPNFLLLLKAYRYVVLFPLAALEGPVVALASGFLISLGIFSVIPTFLIMLLGDVIPDSVYFYLGRVGNKAKLIQKYHINSGLEHAWSNHPKKMLFFGKLAVGISVPILISAGVSKMSWKFFLKHVTWITAVKYAALIAVGYILGASFPKGEKYVSYGEFLFAGLLVVFIVIYIATLRYAKREINELEQS